MSDRYYPGPRGYGPYRDNRNGHYDRRASYDRDSRYPPDNNRGRYDDRYDRYEHPRPRSRSPSRQYHEGYDSYTKSRPEYSFRGAADRGSTFRSQPPPTEFSFRSNGPPAPRFPPEQPRRSPAPPPQPPPTRPKNSRRDQGKREPVGQHGDKAYDGGARPWSRKPPAPHQRDLLRRQHGGSTPEQLYGMNQDGQTRFMDVSSSDNDEGSESGEIEDEDVSDGEGPRKRMKADVTEPAEQTVPKWSNPEYFTALPPPESGLGPKKDIVQVIRKAKVEATAKQDATSNAVKENADFISFSMDDDEMKLSEREESPKMQLTPKRAPTASSKTVVKAPAEPEETPIPKKRAFKQFDPMGPPPPPPKDLDQMMKMGKPIPVTKKTRPPPNLPDISELDLVDVDQSSTTAQSPRQPIPQQKSEPKGKKRKAAEISEGLGDVVAEWRSNGTNPTPWCTVDHTRTASPGLRLHKEISDFYEFVRAHDYEEAVRRNLINRVQHSVQASGPAARNVEIKSFGSFASGLYLPTADMDLVAVSRDYLQSGYKVFCQSNSKMHRLGGHLTKDNVVMPGTLTVITKAKVPIIKYTDRETGIKVDISFENDTGLRANQTFAEWKEKYPAMPVIVVLIKQMLAMRGLNEVYLGGLGGFSIICLVVSMMQHMPELQSGNMDPQLHYGELLFRFLDLYGNRFKLESTGITMDPPSYFDKLRHPHPKQNPQGLTIVDPNNRDNDISGGSRKVTQVFNCFRIAHAEIQRRLKQIHSGENIEDSILGCIWGGNYTSFIHQRNKLSLLQRGQAVSPPPVPEPRQAKKPKKIKPPKYPEQGSMKLRSAGPARGGGQASRKWPPARMPPPGAQGARTKYPLPQRPSFKAADESPPTKRRR